MSSKKPTCLDRIEIQYKTLSTIEILHDTVYKKVSPHCVLQIFIQDLKNNAFMIALIATRPDILRIMHEVDIKPISLFLLKLQNDISQVDVFTQLVKDHHAIKSSLSKCMCSRTQSLVNSFIMPSQIPSKTTKKILLKAHAAFAARK